MILDSCITSGNKSLANNMSTMGLCSRYAGLIWSDPVSHDCGSFLGCGPAIMPYSPAHGDCCGDPKMMRNSNFKFEETARGCFTPKWYEMTWGTFYKKALTQLHWKLQHGSLQSWTQNVGMREPLTAAKIPKNGFQHSWDQEKSCLNLTCFWISTSKWQTMVLCGRNCCRLDASSKELGRQIVPPKVGAPMSSPCGAQRAMVMQTHPNSWMNKLWDSKARQER